MSDPLILIFLSSALFLGWSLGANDAANVFGTAVGSRMVSFTKAAFICGIFVILGAVVSGAGAAQTLGKLGSINAIGGSFMAALAAGLTVYWMTRLGLPVSTTQAIIGSIMGWNFFSDSYTDLSSLFKILSTWILCPVLSAVIASVIFALARKFVRVIRIGLIRLDGYTRLALILSGAFGAYSLGANNIANVMGVFVPVSPFQAMRLTDDLLISSAQQLFLIGGLAIAIGVFTYSKRVMMTVGSELMRLTPLAAWVAVMAHSIVLFLFASEQLEQWLASLNLPTIPLVPVSSSQAVVGAVIGIGMAQGGHEVHWNRLFSIIKGWFLTPLISCMICFFGLFFLQNVFLQSVKNETRFQLSESVLEKLKNNDIDFTGLKDLENTTYSTSGNLTRTLREHGELNNDDALKAIEFAELKRIRLDPGKIDQLDEYLLTENQRMTLGQLKGQRFNHTWEFNDALMELSEEWRIQGGLKNKLSDRKTLQKLSYLHQHFLE